MREIRYSSAFKSEFKKVSCWKGFSADVFSDVVTKLANDIPLDETFRDHELSGKRKGSRECHLAPDILLIYIQTSDSLELLLIEIGSHSSLFKK